MRITKKDIGRTLAFKTFHDFGFVLAKIESVAYGQVTITYDGGRTLSGAWIPVNTEGYRTHLPVNTDRLVDGVPGIA